MCTTLKVVQNYTTINFGHSKVFLINFSLLLHHLHLLLPHPFSSPSSIPSSQPQPKHLIQSPPYPTMEPQPPKPNPPTNPTPANSHRTQTHNLPSHRTHHQPPAPPPPQPRRHWSNLIAELGG